jgi:hypothetical protein
MLEIEAKIGEIGAQYVPKAKSKQTKHGRIFPPVWRPLIRRQPMGKTGQTDALGYDRRLVCGKLCRRHARRKAAHPGADRFRGDIHQRAGKSTSGRRMFYNRKKARAGYPGVAKQRKPRRRRIKQAIKEQIGFVKKNLEVLDGLGQEAWAAMEPKHTERLHTICKVLEQQTSMLQTGSHSARKPCESNTNSRNEEDGRIHEE